MDSGAILPMRVGEKFKLHADGDICRFVHRHFSGKNLKKNSQKQKKKTIYAEKIKKPKKKKSIFTHLNFILML